MPNLYPPSAGRTGSRWKRQHDARIAYAASINEPCYHCKQHCIDYTLPGTAKWGPTIEHIVGLEDGGHPTDPANLMVSSRTHNISRGNEQRIARKRNATLNPSRTW